MTAMTDAMGFFDAHSGGGGGAPSFKHVNVGDTVSGEIVSMREMDQTHYSGPLAGQPIKDEKRGGNKKQLQIVLRTELRNWQGCEPSKDVDGNPQPPSEDEGMRAIYVRGWMIGAVADAVRAAGAKYPEVGGTLAVRLTEAHDTRKQNPKKYDARYKAPAPGAGMFADEAVQADAQAAQESAGAPTPASAAELDPEIPF